MNNFFINNIEKFNSLYYIHSNDVEIIFIYYSAIFIN